MVLAARALKLGLSSSYPYPVQEAVVLSGNRMGGKYVVFSTLPCVARPWANVIHCFTVWCFLLSMLLLVAQAFSEDNSIVWESKDILLALEERFQHAAPLLPTEEAEKQQVAGTGAGAAAAVPPAIDAAEM